MNVGNMRLALRCAFRVTFLPFIKHEKRVWLCVSLSLRLFWGRHEALYLRAFDCDQISKTNLRSTAWPHWHSRRSPARVLSEVEQWPCGRIIGNDSLSRRRQRERYSNIRQSTSYSKSNNESSSIVCNADMHVGEVRKFCKLDGAGESLIRAAMGQMNLSARGYHRVLKLARTIADLAGSESIQAAHLAKALQYRPKLMIG